MAPEIVAVTSGWPQREPQRAQPSQQTLEIIELAKRGDLRLQEIADIYGVSRARVQQITSKYGVPTPKLRTCFECRERYPASMLYKEHAATQGHQDHLIERNPARAQRKENRERRAQMWRDGMTTDEIAMAEGIQVTTVYHALWSSGIRPREEGYGKLRIRRKRGHQVVTPERKAAALADIDGGLHRVAVAKKHGIAVGTLNKWMSDRHKEGN